MRRSLLNKRILPKPLRQALVLITLLLLPSAAWGETKTFQSGEYNLTTGIWGDWNFNGDGVSFTDDYQLKLTVAGSSSRTVTITLHKPSESEGTFVIQKIYLEIPSRNYLSIQTATMNGEDISTGFSLDMPESPQANTYTPNPPIDWTGDIVITLVGDNTSNNSEEIFVLTSASVYATTKNTATFSWPDAVSSANDYDVSGISKSVNEGTGAITLSGHCKEGTKYSFALTPSEGTHTISYSSSNPDNAAIDESTGVVTIRQTGTFTISASLTTEGVYYSTNSYSYTLNITKIDIPYNLTVAGVEVTSGNNEDILNDGGTVKFTPAGQDTPATLTLNYATINGGIVWSQTSDLVIDLAETNTITQPSTNESDAITTAEDLSEKPNLSFTGSGSLAIANESGNYAITEFNTVSLANGLYLKSDWPGAYWDDEDRNTFVGYNSALSSLTITSEVYYPIWIVSDGVNYTQVSGANKENVFNDNDTPTPKVSYDSANNQLTLYEWECATTGGEFAIILGDQESFNIQLGGVNKIGGSVIFFAKEDASLALSTDDELKGSLTIVQNQSNNYYFTNIPDVNITYSKLTRTDNAVTYQAPPITVAGVSPDSEGKFSGISGVTFTPAPIGVDQSSSTPATLTLDNASITGDIKFNASLTVHLIGDNTITKPENISYAFDLGNTARDLNFSTDETEPGTLKIVGSYSDLQNYGIIYNGQIKGGLATIGTTGDNVIWKQTFIPDATPSYFILSLNKHYNLWKNGHQYHDLILDNNDSYVFNPEKSTLTIINSSSSDYINSGLEDLTIIVSGSQSLSHIAFGAPKDTQAEGITTGNLTITGDTTNEGSNSLTLSNPDGIITGFSSVDITLPMHVSEPTPSEFTGWTSNVTEATITDKTYDYIFDEALTDGINYVTYYSLDRDMFLSNALTPSVITEISGSTVKTQALSYIPKNTPVLVTKATNTATTATFTKNILHFAESGKPETASAEKVLYVLYNNQFVKVTPDSSVENGGYLDLTDVNLPSGTRSLTIDGDDEGTTALREVKSEGVKGEKLADGEWYTLQGRKFTTKPTKPGLYILNGKKIVVK